MTDTAQTNNGAKKEALPAHIIIELIKSIGRGLIAKGIPNRQAVVIGQEVVKELTTQYRGEAFYLGVKGPTRQRLFLESSLQGSLEKIDITTALALKISAGVTEDVAFEYRGMSFYLPKNPVETRADNSIRDRLIVAAYLENPVFATIRQLSRDHNIGIRQIYKIIKNKRQPGKKPVSKRDASILAEYRKEPTRETIKRLADEHGLKVGYTYQIVWRLMKQNEGKQNG